MHGKGMWQKGKGEEVSSFDIRSMAISMGGQENKPKRKGEKEFVEKKRKAKRKEKKENKEKKRVRRKERRKGREKGKMEDFPTLRRSKLDSPSTKIGTRSLIYVWTPKTWRFDELHKVGDFPTRFTLSLKAIKW